LSPPPSHPPHPTRRASELSPLWPGSIMVSASIPSYISVVYGCMPQRLPLTQFKMTQKGQGIYDLLIPSRMSSLVPRGATTFHISDRKRTRLNFSHQIISYA